jgi:hypothetical protein
LALQGFGMSASTLETVEGIEVWGIEIGFGRSVRDSYSSTSAPPKNQAASLESQMIPTIQYVPGRALRLGTS